MPAPDPVLAQLGKGSRGGCCTERWNEREKKRKKISYREKDEL